MKTWNDYDLYNYCAENKVELEDVEFQCEPKDHARWCIARYAARQTAIALLSAASKAGVTVEQFEAIRKVAAKVATD